MTCFSFLPSVCDLSFKSMQRIRTAVALGARRPSDASVYTREMSGSAKRLWTAKRAEKAHELKTVPKPYMECRVAYHATWTAATCQNQKVDDDRPW